MTQRGLAVAAVEDGLLLGYLGAYGPWQPVFCTPDVSGMFSPLHAHAVRRIDESARKTSFCIVEFNLVFSFLVIL